MDARARRWPYEQILAEVRDPKEAAEVLKRMINGNDLTDVAFLARGFCARSVCRVEIRSDDDCILGYGTGFLVAPGVIMTNNHVINDAALTRRSKVNFDFERSLDGADMWPAFRFSDPSPPASDAGRGPQTSAPLTSWIRPSPRLEITVGPSIAFVAGREAYARPGGTVRLVALQWPRCRECFWLHTRKGREEP